MNKDLLKGQIRSLGFTQGDIAEKIGVSLSRLNAKINETDGAEFSLGEVQALKDVLQLDSEKVNQIFFS